MSSIVSLPQCVVDLIAAGEIVQRPSSVAKELIENSLDADSTSIEVTCERGGLESLQITDDGNGMSKDDLKMAAVRFATSKLSKFEDLRSIRTFGFRGEALASASMVSRLTIISQRRADPLAHKCQYSDGAYDPSTLRPSAGVPGTTVRVSELFYNVPSRLKSFKKPSEEYARILAVCQRYALHRAAEGVGFVCKKKAGSTVDLNTKTIPSVRDLSLRRSAEPPLPLPDVVKGKARKEVRACRVRERPTQWNCVVKRPRFKS